MTRTYLYGYGAYQSRLTLEELNTRWTWNMVHPELRRRFVRCMDFAQDAGVDLGIGSGARDPIAQLQEALRRHYVVSCSLSHDRTYKGVCYRLRDGYAPYAFPGSSVHETGILDGYALAIDVINWENHWFDRNCERFGIKNFGGLVGPNVNGEEWHGQPLSLPNSKSAIVYQVNQGATLYAIPLPGDGVIPLPPPPQPVPVFQGGNVLQGIYPVRNSDTRVFPGPLQPNVEYEFGIDPSVFPANTVGIFANVGVLDAATAGFLTIWPGGPVPKTATMNIDTGADGKLHIYNGFYGGAVVDGKFKIRATTRMNVIIDITGYWTP